MTEPWQHPSVLYWSFTLLFTETDQKIHRKKWTFNYNLWSWGKAEISGRCFQSSLCVLKQRISICIPSPFFLVLHFSLHFLARQYWWLQSGLLATQLTGFTNIHLPMCSIIVSDFLLKFWWTQEIRVQNCRKWGGEKNRGRESKADRWTTNVEESSPSEKYSKVWSSIPSMLHFFFSTIQIHFPSAVGLRVSVLTWTSVNCRISAGFPNTSCSHILDHWKMFWRSTSV